MTSSGAQPRKVPMPRIEAPMKMLAGKDCEANSKKSFSLEYSTVNGSEKTSPFHPREKEAINK